MKIQPLTEDSLIVYVGDEIEREVAQQVSVATQLIRQNLGDRVIDIIPSYNSIHLTYNLCKTNFFEFHALLRQLLANVEQHSVLVESSKIIEIPVYYGPEVALDMPIIEQHTHRSAEEVIDIHCSELYTVYAIGFSPGFAYLGNTDKQIAIPRKTTPRTRVPAGSLGIADTQTAIYPSESPGGWQILGRTPLNLVDFQQDSLTPVNMGDLVKFVAIDKQAFLSLGGTL
ncbi:5-oxoprolinase subunit PxpB [Endozoicomonas sp. SM1973]|uniref:5-oxoprolinase subunit PxpB n=1 Tax=Spartinivicinus marinus TaxID=2994442 RepID=A0A853I8N4_9GAMM|nr:5-oxoprolinase subunit PxpB [Spartinivicinus marinus]MCX4029174.1 5-oxoprolinase subunit PxpB [Spartinivicinus marinus]NYZ65917.1 5-oxoprolinase subunit PxpB [Spartinivicinus marinus]